MNFKHPKEEIVARGEDLFRLNGYSNTGLSDILTACGVSKGTFYNYFESKDAYLVATLDSYTDRMIRNMNQFMSDTGSSALDRLTGFIGMMIGLNEQEGAVGGCLVNNMSLELAGVDADLARQIERNFQRLISRIAIEIEEGQRDGIIRSDYSAKELAEFIYTGLYGGMSRMKSTRSVDSMRRFFEIAIAFITRK